MIDLSLDDLFAEAKRAMRQVEAKKAKLVPINAPVDPLAIWRNPTNWIAGQGVALISEASNTLIGNFREYHHKTVPGAKKLVREDCTGPLRVDYVKGDWGSTLPTLSPPKRLWKESRTVTVGVRLASPSYYFPTVSVSVHFGEGTPERAELLEETTFTACSTPSDFLTLPAGVDILPQLATSTFREILSLLDQPHD